MIAKPAASMVRRSLVPLVAAGVCLGFPAAESPAQVPSFESQDDELLYYWGTTFGAQLGKVGINDPRELELVARGLRDAAAGRAPEYREEYPSMLNNFVVRRNRELAEAEAEAGREYARKASREKGAIVTESGLVFRELEAGSKPLPKSPSAVTVHYVGTLRDGKVFDSSRERGAPLEISLDRVIPCWSEAIPKMKIGGRAKIVCPAEIAYGDQGNARIPGGATLTFDVEVLAARK